jgi:hypothetical protein
MKGEAPHDWGGQEGERVISDGSSLTELIVKRIDG